MNTPRAVVEKLILAVFVGIAAVVALVPTVCYVAPQNYYFGHRMLLLYFGAVGVLIPAIFFLSRGSEDSLTHGPSLLEYILRGLAAISFWGFLGVVWLLLYGLLYLLARLISYGSGWLLGYSFSATTVAFYISFVFALVMAAGIAAAIAQNVTNRLYSAKISSRIVSYNQVLRGQAKTWGYSAMSVAALLVMGLFIHYSTSTPGFGRTMLFQFIPYGSCAWLLGLGSRVRKDSDIVDAIGRLLKAMDYEVVFSPRVADPSFQTLITGLDIIATKEQVALVIQVKTQSSSLTPVDWTAGSSLRLKAKALEEPELLKELDIPLLKDRKTITPLLVLVGRDPDQTLQEFSKEESLPLVLIDMELIGKVLATESREELRLLADKYFQNIATCGESTPTPPQDQGVVQEGQWAS
jgi:hypothetical protein